MPAADAFLRQPPPKPIYSVTALDTSATVSWQHGPANGCAVTQYNVWWGTRSSLGGYFRAQKTVSGDTTSVTMTGLTPNTEYSLEIIATGDPNAGGCRTREHDRVPQSIIWTRFTTWPSDKVAPARPTAVSVTEVTTGGGKISWTAGAVNGCAVSKFRVQVREVQRSANGERRLVLDKDVSASTSQVTLSQLNHNTRYQALVRAQGNSPLCSSPSFSLWTVQYFTTKSIPATHPPQPFYPKVSEITSHSAAFSWTPGTATACRAAGHRVQVSEWPYAQPVVTTIDKKIAAGTNSVSLTGLKAGQQYRVRVSSYGAATDERCLTTESDGSPLRVSWQHQNFTTDAATPYPPPRVSDLAAAPTTGGVVLTWTHGTPAADNHCRVASYRVRLVTIGNIQIVHEKTLSATATTHTVTGLKQGYNYRAEIVSNAPSGDIACKQSQGASPREFTTRAAAAQPASITVGQVTNTRATVTWEHGKSVPQCSVSEYRVRVTPVGGTQAAYTSTVNSATVEHGVSGLDPETEYTVTVGGYGSGANCGDPFSLGSATFTTAADSIVKVGLPDDPVTPGISVPTIDLLFIESAPVSVTEGDDGKTVLTFTVTLSDTPDADVRMTATAHGAEQRRSKHATKPPTASGNNVDFYQYHSQRSVVFAAGATGDALSKQVQIVVYGDTDVEGDETLVLHINKLRTTDERIYFAGGSTRFMRVEGTIIDDD
ncbi:fibronectin type III domain-containing protein [Candidatus Poriferisodalis sp.]|uniref:fibronectin type III domain-containing protein n=1 Tax=Candidatus Poriferisodalis sp. TaxID=3101277 RepID=UPI003B0286E8